MWIKFQAAQSQDHQMFGALPHKKITLAMNSASHICRALLLAFCQQRCLQVA
jgi:hypothetical protein